MSLTVPGLSAASIHIRGLLSATKTDEVITLDQIAKSVGMSSDELKKKDHLVYSAIKHAESEHIVFYRVRNVGWRRMPTSTAEVVDSESGVPKRITRTVKRSLKRIESIEFEKLSNADKLKHCTIAGQLGAIATFASSKARDKINTVVIANGTKPDHSRLMELFKE